MVTINLEEVSLNKKKMRDLVTEGFSVAEWVMQEIDILLLHHETTEDAHYLETAFHIMQAYMELGFCYEDNQQGFDKLLQQMGSCREVEFPRMLFPAKRISLNKSRLKIVIGKWISQKQNKMTAPELYADIIQKVNSHQEGIYIYDCRAAKYNYTNRVKLFVGSKESCLYQANTDKFYLFEKGGGGR